MFIADPFLPLPGARAACADIAVVAVFAVAAMDSLPHFLPRCFFLLFLRGSPPAGQVAVGAVVGLAGAVRAVRSLLLPLDVARAALADVAAVAVGAVPAVLTFPTSSPASSRAVFVLRAVVRFTWSFERGV